MISGVRAAFDRFNAAHPWDHNRHYHRWILRQLPARFGRALDVGCGSGELARALAERADSVDAIDQDPEILRHAGDIPRHNIRFRQQDARELPPGGDYDVITCVATLHHLPFAETLRTLRANLAPGGRLVVLGVYQPQTIGDWTLALMAVPANLAVGWAKSPRGGKRPVAMTAVTRPASMPLAEIRRVAARELPGARIRRHLFWRYSLVFGR
ncbi:class I SAM-dependent methyltransferase [Saccharopolyspora taberi]|uniref:Class I SAM-dependent methyltransferase n=1 Tax=Saccharopolyspora taberi TaxID=60895 RepID=A0ABN3VD44_9PSEU